VEASLVELWTQLLGRKQVGIHDNFFELGGHSLLATQLVSRIRDRFQVELPLRSVFETPIIAELAQKIEALRWAARADFSPVMNALQASGSQRREEVEL
jgi:acyl carrier protein